MGKIIAVVNQKGGVGKTTTAVNLTAALKELGLNVLLIDFDPQANATSGFGVDKRTAKYNVYDVLINNIPAVEAIVTTKYGDVLPATADLAGASLPLPILAKELGKPLFYHPGVHNTGFNLPKEFAYLCVGALLDPEA